MKGRFWWWFVEVVGFYLLLAVVALALVIMTGCGALPSFVVEDPPSLDWSEADEPTIEGEIDLHAAAGGTIARLVPWRVELAIEAGVNTANFLSLAMAVGFPGFNGAVFHVAWYWSFLADPGIRLCVGILAFKVCWGIEAWPVIKPPEPPASSIPFDAGPLCALRS